MDRDNEVIGRKVGGRFRITGYLGEGAMARVYRGVEEPDGRDVAIKLMNPDHANEESVRRFRREAKAAAALRHPNTVHILDHGVEAGNPYIVMELLEGKDLFDVLATHGRLPEAHAANIVIQICEALSAAHALGIIHRDLKPENVMLLRKPEGTSEHVKVLDFGIAKVLGRYRAEEVSSGSSLTAAGAVVGTPEYMSPEQCEDSEVDARSDIYACGVLLYRILTGRVPFSSAVALDTMLRHLREPPPPPSRYAPGLHAGLEALILRALAKEPADRPPTARAFSEELWRILPELTGPQRALRLASSTPPPVGAGARPGSEPDGELTREFVAPRTRTASPEAVIMASAPSSVDVSHFAGPSGKGDAPAAAPARPAPAAPAKPATPGPPAVAKAPSVGGTGGGTALGSLIDTAPVDVGAGARISGVPPLPGAPLPGAPPPPGAALGRLSQPPPSVPMVAASPPGVAAAMHAGPHLPAPLGAPPIAGGARSAPHLGLARLFVLTFSLVLALGLAVLVVIVRFR